MARTMTFTATLTPEEGGYVARCMELDVTSEGDSVEEALEMLREAVALYLEDEPAPAPLGPPGCDFVRRHGERGVNDRTPRLSSKEMVTVLGGGDAVG